MKTTFFYTKMQCKICCNQKILKLLVKYFCCSTYIDVPIYYYILYYILVYYCFFIVLFSLIVIFYTKKLSDNH